MDLSSHAKCSSTRPETARPKLDDYSFGVGSKIEVEFGTRESSAYV
jgi:hypothetical protein